jgi:Fe-S-cluster-containing hydrogenase component 2
MVSTKKESHAGVFDILGTFFGKDEKTVAEDNAERKPKAKRIAIKCDNCMGYSDTACTNNCPTNAIRWVNPIEYFGDFEDVLAKRGKYQ